jgi:2-isopropylmalate synthase
MTSLRAEKLRVICGTEGPQEADMVLSIDGVDHHIDATGDGPVDAAFNCVKMLFPHKARLQLYQVHAVTEGTDAQATVSVRLEEDGLRIVNRPVGRYRYRSSPRTVKAYINALNRPWSCGAQKTAPGEDADEGPTSPSPKAPRSASNRAMPAPQSRLP